MDKDNTQSAVAYKRGKALQAFEKQLTDLFTNDDIVSTFHVIREKHLPDFEGLSSEEIEEKILSLENDREFRKGKDEIKAEIAAFEGNLERITNDLMRMAKANLFPNGTPPLDVHSYDEIAADCLQCPGKLKHDIHKGKKDRLIARGHFKPDTPPERAPFAPLTLAYMTGNEEFTSHKKLKCKACGNRTLFYERAAHAKIIVAKVKAPTQQIDALVETFAQRWRIIREYRINAIESQQEVIERFFRPLLDTFHIPYAPSSQKGTSTLPIRWGSVDKESLYRALELFYMASYRLVDIVGEGNDQMIKLFTDIAPIYISQPFMRIRSRIKDTGRLADKIIESVYTDEEQKTRDLYGCRIILQDEVQCEKLLSDILEHSGFWKVDSARIEDPKSGDLKRYIGESKKESGYEGYHVKVYMYLGKDKKDKDITVPFAIQIRTFEMDRRAEFDASQRHDLYVDRKRDFIMRCPEDERRILNHFLSNEKPTRTASSQ